MAILGDPDSVWKDLAPCDGCKTETPLMLLDATPDERLLCKTCYEPGWLPVATETPP